MSGIKIVQESMNAEVDVSRVSVVSDGSEKQQDLRVELDKIDFNRCLRTNQFPSMEHFSFEKMRFMNIPK
jgi:hypothetical protein